MMKMKYILHAAALAAATILVLPDSSYSSYFSSSDSYYTTNIEESDASRVERFAVDGHVELEAKTIGGWIEILQGSNDEVKVEMFVERSFRLFGRDQSLDQHRIIIDERDNRVRAVAEPRGDGGPMVSFRITVPEETSARAKSTGGRISVRDLSGNHRITGTGGAVEVNGVSGKTQVQITGSPLKAGNINGSFHVEGIGGSIFASNVNGEARIRSRGGQVQVLNVEGALLIENIGGNVLAHIEKLGEGVKINSQAGSIDFIIDEDDAYDLHAQSTVASDVNLYEGISSAALTEIFSGDHIERASIASLASKRESSGSTLKLHNGSVPVDLIDELGRINVYMISSE